MLFRISCLGFMISFFGDLPQYARIILQPGYNTKDMYKKKKVAASKHRRRAKKLKERRKAQAQTKEQ
jgi:hypothetical protein